MRETLEFRGDLTKIVATTILLDIGGIPFVTRISTLTDGAAEGSMLAAMFSGRHNIEQDEKDGSYFIDRDSTHFETGPEGPELED